VEDEKLHQKKTPLLLALRSCGQRLLQETKSSKHYQNIIETNETKKGKNPKLTRKKAKKVLTN